MGFINNIMNSFKQREIKKIEKIVDKIDSLEAEFEKKSDQELKDMTNIFKERLEKGETLDDILEESFATVREVSKRVLGMRHYRVQLIGGIVLHQGRISEMRTGEGKTLVATCPVYLNALSSKGVHVITVNDYLATRDKEWMAKIYEFLGLTTGVIVHGQTPQERKEAYNKDITYGTNNEFGFDYLRDNMVSYKEKMVQRPLNFAIVDEVDSILVDEARTPLIISGAGDKSTDLYFKANDFVRSLKNEVDFEEDEKAKNATLTDEGINKAEKFFNIDDYSSIENMEIQHHINQSLKAHRFMKKDIDYVIKDGEIVIVDEFTGRLMFGRRYSDGLHQSIEAKENLKVQRESKTLASITFQNYFRMYKKLSGMTGTAKTEEEEFKSIYGMDVVEIPTNRPIQRIDSPDAIYKTLRGKLNAIVEEIKNRHETKQPVLVGTISIEMSELLSSMLKKKGVKHQVLNAKHHEKEAEIVAQAGGLGAVTIATNMAGRGTDIVLGGNSEFLAKKELKKRGYDDYILSMVTALKFDENNEELKKAKEDYEQILKEIESKTKVEQEEVLKAGGLCILGTERHESRRIDNQLRGRAGRQGDPGFSRFYICLEDDIMRLFGSEKIMDIVDKIGMEEDMPIEHKLLSRSIESAQKKVESKNFSIRKHVLQYDDVMNKQREIIYKERRSVLENENLKEQIFGMVESVIDNSINIYTADSDFPEDWDIKALKDHIYSIYLPKDSIEFGNLEELDRTKIKDIILSKSKELYEFKEADIGIERMRELERIVLLQVVDTKWMDHIDAMEQLRQGIGLRAIGQEDPVRAYQFEGFDMFDNMVSSIHEETVKYLYNFKIEFEIERKEVVDTDNLEISRENNKEVKKSTTIVKGETIGRNDPCPCGSGKKYKKCCGK
ncbi:MAG: preprotein translocase subunit SecA [Peptostreptococcaceae bacterium]|nr:preprotein translocase subunit SecA [Peptostreptococcaceae bacterium]